MKQKKLLIIGFVWPEPTSSAAGTRIIQLVDLFLEMNYQITFASAASKSEYSYDFTGKKVIEQEIRLNDNSFNTFLHELRPELVLFDRFMIEEQYGWRVQQECPDALTILDTEDLHFLRQARQTSLKKAHDEVDLHSDVAKREIASIYRCDLSLIISELEMQILNNKFNIPSNLLHYLPFMEEQITDQTTSNWIPFSERHDFIFIGNFLHEPNWNTVQVLKHKIWPVLSQKLPQAKLNIYGAYASQKVTQLNNKKERFLVQGRAENARKTLSKHRILLAPIQFGAGVKGKFIDAMQVGTPSVTTSIGAEAMHGNHNWSGAIEDNPEKFINLAVELHQDETKWLKAQENGANIINDRYARNKFSNDFFEKVNKLSRTLSAHRMQNFFGQVLKHSSNQSTKYMSLWIEEKNKKTTELLR